MTQKKTDILHRSFEIRADSVAEDDRTVELAFSSEEPVERWFGREILDHNPQSIRLGRLNGGGALLVDHNMSDQVGVVESARIDSDKVGRAVVRFGKSDRASEIFTDIKDGIRRHVSVGYRVHKMILDGEQDGVETYRVTDFEPFEISIVSVPADPTVGVARDFDFRSFVKDEKPTEVKIMSEEIKPVDKIDIKAETDRVRKVELARIADIQAMGDQFEATDMAREFIKEGKGADEFRAKLLEVVQKRQSEQSKPQKIELTEKEQQRYSLMAVTRALATGDWSKAGYERELSFEIAERIGSDAKGIYVPEQILARGQQVQQMTTGGALVETGTGTLIESLRPMSIALGLGATVVDGLVGNVDLPKVTGNSTAYWLAEDEDTTDSALTFGVVSLAPRTIAAAVPISRRMMKQSSISIDELVRMNILRSLALGIDDAIMEGDGVKKPLGIVSVTGVATSTIASAGAPTWAELVEFESDVDTANALTGSLAYATTPTVAGTMKTTAKDSGSGLFLMEGNEANGYPVAKSSQLAANRIIFGNWADVYVGMWGAVDLMVDDKTNAANGGVVLRAFQDMDSAVGHAGSFCINA